MHYKNGKEAKVGDRVVGKDTNGNPTSGVLVDIMVGSDTCNGYIVPLDIYKLVTLSDCLLLEDL